MQQNDNVDEEKKSPPSSDIDDSPVVSIDISNENEAERIEREIEEEHRRIQDGIATTIRGYFADTSFQNLVRLSDGELISTFKQVKKQCDDYFKIVCEQFGGEVDMISFAETEIRKYMKRFCKRLSQAGNNVKFCEGCFKCDIVRAIYCGKNKSVNFFCGNCKDWKCRCDGKGCNHFFAHNCKTIVYMHQEVPAFIWFFQKNIIQRKFCLECVNARNCDDFVVNQCLVCNKTKIKAEFALVGFENKILVACDDDWNCYDRIALLPTNRPSLIPDAYRTHCHNCCRYIRRNCFKFIGQTGFPKVCTQCFERRNAVAGADGASAAQSSTNCFLM